MPYPFTRHEHWNDVGTGIIGVLDIIAGLIIYFGRSFSFTSFHPILFLSFFYLTVGTWSIFKNVLRKNYFDWRGWVDIINTFCLFSVYSGSVFEIFWLLGIIIMVKGGMSLFLITTRQD
jgi:hypothetical protein